MANDQASETVVLNSIELDLLNDYDSRLFGFLHLEGDENTAKKKLLVKAVQYYDQQLKSPDKNNLDTSVLCKIGHFHLILGDYSKALSAYQKFFTLQPDYWKDATFLYGLGMVYFHFSAYQWAIRAFQQVLYIDSGFSRANEVHLRLGHMFKVNGDYETSLKHYQLALVDNTVCSLSKAEIKFHIAHLHEVQGNHQTAKEAYQELLTVNPLSDTIKCAVHRQLGWLHHTSDQQSDRTAQENQAIQCLHRSLEIDPNSGQTWYFLGRCYSALNKVHEAFVSYRHSIDKSEANADTWCSIGVLYQQQNQPMDALQAYICAVQLDKSHTSAWTDLGILYEACSQPQDALTCYLNASKTTKTGINPALTARINLMQAQMNAMPPPNMQNKSKTLPSIEEAWSLPIPAELTSRQGNMAAMQQTRKMHPATVVTKGHPPAYTGQPPDVSQSNGPVDTLEQPPNSNPSEKGNKKKKSSGKKKSSTSVAELLQQRQQQSAGGQAATTATEEPTTPSGDTHQPPPQQVPPYYLTPQQVALMQQLLQNQANLSPDQVVMLQHLQQNYWMMQEHQKQIASRLESPNLDSSTLPASIPQGPGRAADGTPTSHAQSPLPNGLPELGYHQSSPAPHRVPPLFSQSGGPGIPLDPALLQTGGSPHGHDFPAPNVVAPQNPDIPQKLADFHRSRSGPPGADHRVMLSPQEIADNMLAELSSAADSTTPPPGRGARGMQYGGGASPHSSRGLDGVPNGERTEAEGGIPGITEGHLGLFKTPLPPVDPALETTFQLHELERDPGRAGTVHPSLDPRAAADRLLHGASRAAGELDPEKLAAEVRMNGDIGVPNHVGEAYNSGYMNDVGSSSPTKSLGEPPGGVSVYTSSSEVLRLCRKLKRNGLGFNHTILTERLPPPSPPTPPYPPLPKEQLNPPTPSVNVTSKSLAHSPGLADYCISPDKPITLIQGLAAALKLDLGLFSTKTLVETNSEHAVEVRTQRQQPPDENWDQLGICKVWKCDSNRSFSTIAKYAQYQASSFQESLREETEKNNVKHSSDGDTSGSSKKKMKYGPGREFKMLKFGTNVDLSDQKKWGKQLHELTKLPSFIKVASAGNLLSHIGHTILGMNSVQLYMKVPGSRTPGHQENNNFSSVNINIGPGDCEWFAVSEEYWGSLYNLCERASVNFLKGSWWPDLDDLFEENVPVYRFIQRPGDLVWVNSGTVHWVQALGWCNNIAWNVGPLTPNQFRLALKRYEWNKLQGYKSIVPMIHLTWNMAKNVSIREHKLYELLKFALLRTLKHCEMVLKYLKADGVKVHWHGRDADEQAHYCHVCEVEVFNILYTTRQKDRKYQVYCYDCARKTHPQLEGFVVLQQYSLQELNDILDAFISRMTKLEQS